MEFIVIYAIISNIDDDIKIQGPLFGGIYLDDIQAKEQARVLANAKTKEVIIPWVFELRSSIPDMMSKARDTWFYRFRMRVLDSAQTLRRDNTVNSCPFSDINIPETIKYYIHY